MSVSTCSAHACFGVIWGFYEHDSRQTGTPTRSSVFVPGGERPFSARRFFSGLTCTEENITAEADAPRIAVELGLVLVAPDTSPRGEAVADDADAAHEFGFYVDAIEEPWAKNYRMYSYIGSGLDRRRPTRRCIQAGRPRSLDGWRRRAHHRASLSLGFHLLAHRLAGTGTMRRKGARPLSWRGPFEMARA